MQKMTAQIQGPIEALLLDYDGTITPLHVSTVNASVPLQTQAVLTRIGRKIPVIVVTSKAPDFVIPRTPFATGWCTINGLETRLGERVFRVPLPKLQLELVSTALKYATKRLVPLGIDVEEKRLSNQQLVGFCVDWNHSRDFSKAQKAASRVAKHLRASSLYVCGLEGDTFFDVYPSPAHKGRAVEAIRERLGIKGGVAYMGDSEMDNPAFLLSNLSIGVLHDDSKPGLCAEYFARFEDLADSLELNLRSISSCKINRSKLCCDYNVQFEDVPEFLSELWKNELVFSPSFSSIKIVGEVR